MSDGWNGVRALAEEQWGLVTKQQVMASGIAWSTLSRQATGGALERVAHGVYRLRGAAEAEHMELRAAWLQLSPATPAWARRPEQGVVSYCSAADLYGIGPLPADVHEFTLPYRKQTRRADVRLHRGEIGDRWILLDGLPVTRPSRIAADLLADHADPGAVAQIVADALREVFDYPADMAQALTPLASAYGLHRGDGFGLLRWLLELSGDPDRAIWLDEAREAMSSWPRKADDTNLRNRYGGQ